MGNYQKDVHSRFDQYKLINNINWSQSNYLMLFIEFWRANILSRGQNTIKFFQLLTAKEFVPIEVLRFSTNSMWFCNLAICSVLHINSSIKSNGSIHQTPKFTLIMVRAYNIRTKNPYSVEFNISHPPTFDMCYTKSKPEQKLYYSYYRPTYVTLYILHLYNPIKRYTW